MAASYHVRLVRVQAWRVGWGSGWKTCARISGGRKGAGELVTIIEDLWSGVEVNGGICVTLFCIEQSDQESPAVTADGFKLRD